MLNTYWIHKKISKNFPKNRCIQVKRANLDVSFPQGHCQNGNVSLTHKYEKMKNNFI